jgi:O-Antigen ligase
LIHVKNHQSGIETNKLAGPYSDAPVERESGGRIAGLLSKVIFVSLLLLMVLTAIPYGTVEEWWKALFVCFILVLSIGWIIEGLISGSWHTGGRPVLLPLVALAAFSFLQTISLRTYSAAGISSSFWNAISADPYATRFFTLQLIAIILAGALFYRYGRSRTRVHSIIFVIIGIAVASALFGIIRQTTQHRNGFGLALLLVDSGYGQFINKNHFAYLMEMAFGLSLGLIVGRGISKERGLIYFAALLPIWMALVLSNSRGGLLAMLAQVVIALLLFTSTPGEIAQPEHRLVRIVRSWPVRIFLVAVLVVGMSAGILWVGGDRLASSLEAVHVEFDASSAPTREGAKRNEIWKATLQMFRNHPVAGVGMGGFWTAITAYHNASGKLTPQEAHNDYLELLASGGLIGLVLAAWFAVVVLRRIRLNLSSRDRFRRATSFAATLGIAGVAVHSLVDFGLHIVVNAFIFIALIAIATSEPERPGDDA